MALQTTVERIVPHLAKQWAYLGVGTGASTLVLSATNTRQAFIFQAPRTGTIDRIAFGASVFTSAGTVQGMLEGVSAGVPNGVALPSGSPGTVSVGATGWFEITPAAGYSIVGDALAAAILEWSGTAGSFQVAVAGNTSTWGASGFPYNARFTGGSWTRGASPGPYSIALRYSDTGEWWTGSGFIGTAIGWGTVSHASNTAQAAPPSWNGAEIGNEWVQTTRRRYNRVWSVRSSSSNAADVVVEVDGSTVRTVSLGASTGAAAGNVFHQWSIGSPLIVAAGSTVRVTHRPTTTSANSMRFAQWASQALKRADDFPDTTRLCYRTGTGAWQYVDEALFGVGLVSDQEEDGVSVGGGAAFPLVGFGGLVR
jgi:hypothetical protein